MHVTLRSGAAFCVIAGATVLTAVTGARATRRGKPWYQQLRKSPLNPPESAFGPVWTTIYLLNGVSAMRVHGAAASSGRTRTLALWGTQQALNAAWSPTFFGLRRPRVNADRKSDSSAD